MKKIWITLLALIILNSCLIEISATESINATYPKNVTVGEAFEVNLTLINFTEDIYDVKIDITNSTDSSQRLSEILDGTSWHSTYSYVNNATNTSESNLSIFWLNITSEFNGTANITIKIRNGIEKIFENYQINIIPAQIQNTSENNSANTTPEPYLEIEWDEEEIINGEEFEVKVKAYNLEEDEYKIKVWIEFEDNDTVISNRYGENKDGEKAWLKGDTYWIYNFFDGSGNKSDRIKLKIRSDYEDFYGDARIFFRLNNNEEISEEITILEREEDEKPENVNALPVQTTTVSQTKNTVGITGNIIQLGKTNETEDLKEQEHILYQSKLELIKKYAIYAFAFFCIALSCLLAFNKLN